MSKPRMATGRMPFQLGVGQDYGSRATCRLTFALATTSTGALTLATTAQPSVSLTTNANATEE